VRAALLLSLLILSLVSCSGGKTASQEVAKVNGTPIPLKDFQWELALASRRDPSFKVTPQTLKDKLSIMVDRTLMIQEAMKMGLAEDQRFEETIKTFWEQTLIRDLIDAKAKEWDRRIFVTEDEIETAYRKMPFGSTQRPPLQAVHDEIRSTIRERKRQEAMDDWLKEIRKTAAIQVNAQRLQGVAHGE
jgi:hypothetical protein